MNVWREATKDDDRMVEVRLPFRQFSAIVLMLNTCTTVTPEVIAGLSATLGDDFRLDIADALIAIGNACAKQEGDWSPDFRDKLAAQAARSDQQRAGLRDEEAA